MWATPTFTFSQEQFAFMTWSVLLARSAPRIPTQPPSTPSPLGRLLKSFSDNMDSSRTSLLQEYTTLLQKSDTAFGKLQQRPKTASTDVTEEHYRISTWLREVWDCINSAFCDISEQDRILSRAGLWPRISPRDVLDKLTLSQRSRLSESWVAVLVKYAEGITMVQRAIRSSRLTKPEYQAELERELSNPGRVGWRATSHPDWLLIELESNLLVRQVQAEIASEMLAPGSGKNTVVQLNMGEGKSSVRGPPPYSITRS
jgi:hypothetical protein